MSLSRIQHLDISTYSSHWMTVPMPRFGPADNPDDDPRVQRALRQALGWSDTD